MMATIWNFLSKTTRIGVSCPILIACALPFLSIQSCSADGLVKEENFLLPVQIGSQTEELETLIVRPVDSGKFPLVLIVNGSHEINPSEARADWLAGIAHDFAHRGWVAASVLWPGYGRSTGTFIDQAGNCTHPKVKDFLNERADELAAALNALHTRGDVDSSFTLGLGFSIGGASLLDLAARASRPLTAVINVSGGVYHYDKSSRVPTGNCSLFQDDLVRSFSEFGRNNPTPALWFYAANDPYFGPSLAQQLLAGYRLGGGNVDFVGLPPFEANGHTLFKWGANSMLEPKIDGFLHHNNLPAMSEAELAPLLPKLTPSDRSSAELYFKQVTEKAVAAAEGVSGLYWTFGYRSIEGARQQALSRCEAKSGKTCHIIVQNNHLVDGWRQWIHDVK